MWVISICNSRLQLPLQIPYVRFTHILVNIAPDSDHLFTDICVALATIVDHKHCFLHLEIILKMLRHCFYATYMAKIVTFCPIF